MEFHVCLYIEFSISDMYFYIYNLYCLIVLQFKTVGEEICFPNSCVFKGFV